MGAAVAVAALASPLLASPAGAEYEQVEYWQTPSKGIVCQWYRDADHGSYVMCTTTLPRKKGSGSADLMVVHSSGRTERRSTPAGTALDFPGPLVTQPYNTTWWLYGGTPKLHGDKRGLQCRVHKRRGITCKAKGHGFRVAKGVATRF